MVAQLYWLSSAFPVEGKVIQCSALASKAADPCLLVSISVPAPMACPAAGVLLGLGHLLLRATWMACGSTSFPWPSNPSGAVWPLEAEATAVCLLTPKTQSALRSSLGTERESKLIERGVSPWYQRVILKLGFELWDACMAAAERWKVRVLEISCCSQPRDQFWAKGERQFMGFREGQGYLKVWHARHERSEQTWNLA